MNLNVQLGGEELGAFRTFAFLIIIGYDDEMDFISFLMC